MQKLLSLSRSHLFIFTFISIILGDRLKKILLWSMLERVLPMFSSRSLIVSRLWCCEGLGAGGKGDDRGWDGWMASRTRWTWVWVNSGNWWWTGRPAVLQFRGSQRVGDEWAAEVNWTDVAISHCSFNFQFLYDRERTSFHILICHLNDFLDKISVHIFAHVIIVFFSNCGVLRVLYVLDKSFSDICSGNIFSQLWLVLSLS